MLRPLQEVLVERLTSLDPMSYMQLAAVVLLGTCREPAQRVEVLLEEMGQGRMEIQWRQMVSRILEVVAVGQITEQLVAADQELSLFVTQFHLHHLFQRFQLLQVQRVQPQP
jgi:hypothetical protein